jgi:hypothetical protein
MSNLTPRLPGIDFGTGVSTQGKSAVALRYQLAALVALVIVVLPPIGWSAEGSDGLPATAETLFDQAASCSLALKRFDGVRDATLSDGSVRWNCSDVPGVRDFGQEYCEYNAVSNGKIVTNLSSFRLTAGARVQCVFTAVFNDTKGQDPRLMRGLGAKANLGAKIRDAALVQMDKRSNSRQAASTLISHCAESVPGAPTEEVRQAACFQASLLDAKRGNDLAGVCRGHNLTDEAQWAKARALGAKVLTSNEAGYDAQRDLAACLATKRAGGVTWRSSDELICGRVRRASDECSCAYDPIPESTQGLTFAGWTNDTLPIGCRHAQIDGHPYQSLVICELSPSEVDDFLVSSRAPRNVGQLCERFSQSVVLKLSLRRLEKSGTCDPGRAPFCAAYVGKSK